MSVALEKTKEILRRYEAGGPLSRHIQDVVISGTNFQRMLREHSELREYLDDIDRQRARNSIDELDACIDTDTFDPKRARVKAHILTSIAEKRDPDRFGERQNLQVEQTVSVAAALRDAHQRRSLPRRDLSGVADAQVTEIPRLNAPSTTDSQSEGPAVSPDPAVNPFDD